MATKTKKATGGRKATDRGDVWVLNVQTGIHHLVPAEQARYLIGQRDPLSGAELFREGSEPETPEGYDHDDPDTHHLASQRRGSHLAPTVTEAAYGVPDDAVATDAAAMAERGGQPKGSVAGPTIPQQNRTDRGPREASGHPLARSEQAKGKVKADPDAVRKDVAERHAASANLPPEDGGDPATGEPKGGE